MGKSLILLWFELILTCKENGGCPRVGVQKKRIG